MLLYAVYYSVKIDLMILVLLLTHFCIHVLYTYMKGIFYNDVIVNIIRGH